MKKNIIILFSLFFLLGSIIKAQSVPDSIYYERLYYTGKAWGFIKYFHSNVAKGNLSWDTELIRTLRKIKIDTTEAEFNKTLLALIKRAGTLSYPDTALVNVPDSLKFNLNLNWLQSSIFSDSVKSYLDSIRIKFRPQDNYYVKNYRGNRSSSPTFDTDNRFYRWGSNQYPSEELRSLALFRYWNIINYFFPYKNIMDQNWDSTLVEFIPKIINSANAKSFHLAFLELATRINDSHAYTFSEEIGNIKGLYFFPLTLKYVENETVVTGVFTENEKIKVGDIIKSIDGNEIYSLRDSLRKFTQGSNNSKINRNINDRIIQGTNGDVEIVVQNPEGQTSVILSRSLNATEYYSVISNENPIWQIMESNSQRFGYVDMGKLEVSNIQEMFNDLWNTDALIFDIRNYPNGTMWSMVEYLFDEPINVANFTVPDITYPGTLFWHKEYVGQYNSTPSYDKPIIILFDESTISQAEYTIMALEQHPKAVKIGSQTAGADGNVSTIYLPGGIIAYFTGLGVFYPDFTQTQRIGIVPDLEVLPTITGIRDGRDEVLEAALNYNITNVNDEKSSEIPNNFALYQNYPNPFNPSTTIKYSVPELSNVKIEVFNMLGQKVTFLVNTNKIAGYYETTWNAENLSSGIYFINITANGINSNKNFVQTKKALLLK